MYIPEPFQITDSAVIEAFVEKHPFGTLLFNGQDGIPVVAHIPFLFRKEGEKWLIEGHLAKANPQSLAIRSGNPAKLIIIGAHGYVSSGVYGHVNVPTYNYQAVHFSGMLDRLSDTDLRKHLVQVVNHFEQNRENPVNVSELPKEMLNAYEQEIIGFRLTVFKTEAAFKLSQNRNDADFENVVADLRKGNADQCKLAEEMQKIRK
jgi:transcriptional regulator